MGPLKEAIIDAARIGQLLTRAEDESANALIYLVSEADKQSAEIAKGHFKSISKERLVIELDNQNLNKSKQSISSAGSEVFIAIYLKNASVIGCRVKVESLNENSVSFIRPRSIYLIQRRKHPRYSIPGGYEVQAQILASSSDLIGSFRVSDLSEAGIGIEVSDSEQFQKFEALSRVIVRFRLQNQQFEIGAQIRSRVNHKIGLEFDGMSESAKEWLSDFVTSQLAQYLQR